MLICSNREWERIEQVYFRDWNLFWVTCICVKLLNLYSVNILRCIFPSYNSPFFFIYIFFYSTSLEVELTAVFSCLRYAAAFEGGVHQHQHSDLQNHKTVEVGGLCTSPCAMPCSEHNHWCRLVRTLCRKFLNIPRDGDSTVGSNLFQCLITQTVEDFSYV